MMAPTLGWYREQSEHNRAFYELVQVACPDKFRDWKVNTRFCSGPRRINYRLSGRRTGPPKPF